MTDNRLRTCVKGFFNALSIFLMSPPALSSLLEKKLSSGEEIFAFWAHSLAILPGLPGMYLRRAFYHMTLDHCALDCFIGFGTIFTHRHSCVEEGVYIGSYSLIGCAHLRSGCLIGSRTSILSGSSLHAQDSDGRWLPSDLNKLRIVEVGAHSWIGEGAIIMADIGERALVGAGSIVSTSVPNKTAIVGNPARLVRNFEQKWA